MENEIFGKTSAATVSYGVTHSAVPSAPTTGTSSPVASDMASFNLTAQKLNVLLSADKQRQQLTAAVDNLNRMMSDGARNLSFAMDEVVGGPVVVVKNSSTGEVIRQLPNEVVVRMAHEIADFKGKLHNSSV
jgi:flagellar protein FlaG